QAMSAVSKWFMQPPIVEWDPSLSVHHSILEPILLCSRLARRYIVNRGDSMKITRSDPWTLHIQLAPVPIDEGAKLLRRSLRSFGQMTGLIDRNLIHDWHIKLEEDWKKFHAGMHTAFAGVARITEDLLEWIRVLDSAGDLLRVAGIRA